MLRVVKLSDTRDYGQDNGDSKMKKVGRSLQDQGKNRGANINVSPSC